MMRVTIKPHTNCKVGLQLVREGGSVGKENRAEWRKGGHGGGGHEEATDVVEAERSVGKGRRGLCWLIKG